MLSWPEIIREDMKIRLASKLNNESTTFKGSITMQIAEQSLNFVTL